MKTISPLAQNEEALNEHSHQGNTDQQAASATAVLPGDELDQVRELLFGRDIREIERHKNDLRDVNAGMAETEKLINQRFDEIARRVEALQKVIERDRAERKAQIENEAKRIDAALVELASEQANARAQEKKRIDDVLDAINIQLSLDKSQHVEALKSSVADERSRLAQRMLTLANSIKDDLT